MVQLRSYSTIFFKPNLNFRSEMCKSTYVEMYQNVDYIYCLSCIFHDSVGTNFQRIEVNDTTVTCNLEQRQRSSQQILDLADYLNMHSDTYKPMRRWDSPESFSSHVPLWIVLANPVFQRQV